MTITQAHRLFRLSLDKMDGLNYPNFRPEEIDVIFNQAYRRYVKQRYGRTNPKRLGVEEDQKRREDLKALIKDGEFNLANTVKLNSYNTPAYVVTLEDDHWFTIYERAILNCPTCNQNITRYVFSDSSGGGVDDPDGSSTQGQVIISGTYVDVIPTTHLELNKVLKDPFSRPEGTVDKVVLRLENDGNIELITPSTCTPLYYIYKYIKKPTEVSLTNNITFETSDHTHEEIVTEAVKMALEGIEAKRTQTYTPIIDNTKE